MKKVVYDFEYLADNGRTNVVVSEVELKEGDTIVIEKRDRGIFLGRITGINDIIDAASITYKYVQHVDLAAYFDAIEKEKKKAELRKEMEAKFAELDKEKKYAYYATLDEGFKALYDEYTRL